VNDYVVDASALVLALNGKTADAGALRARLPGMRRHAPHLIDAEVGNVLRRHESDARVSGREAYTALHAARVLIEHRYPAVGALAARAWTLRHNLTFYDALYVALADQLDIPLLTVDTRLSKAPASRARWNLSNACTQRIPHQLEPRAFWSPLTQQDRIVRGRCACDDAGPRPGRRSGDRGRRDLGGRGEFAPGCIDRTEHLQPRGASDTGRFQRHPVSAARA